MEDTNVVVSTASTQAAQSVPKVDSGSPPSTSSHKRKIRRPDLTSAVANQTQKSTEVNDLGTSPNEAETGHKDKDDVENSSQNEKANGEDTNVTSPDISDIEKKKLRASKFGTDLVLTEEDKKRARRERFGVVDSAAIEKSGKSIKEKDISEPKAVAKESNGSAASKISSEEEKAKKAARAERFGISTATPSAAVAVTLSSEESEEEMKKKKARAERFKLSPADLSQDTKKKLREDKFAPLSQPSA